MSIDDTTLALISLAVVCALALLILGGLVLSARSYLQLIDLIKFLADWITNFETRIHPPVIPPTDNTCGQEKIQPSVQHDIHSRPDK